MSLQTIPVEQLQVGHYIRLDGSWKDYPFLFRSFKIKNKQQIETLLDLGLETISFDPAKSKVKPGKAAKARRVKPDQRTKTAKTTKAAKKETPQKPVEVEVHEEAVSPGETIDRKAAQEAYQERARRLEQLKARRLSQNRCEKAFKQSVSNVNDLMGDMRAQPKETLVAAEKLVGDIVTDVMGKQDITMQLVNIKGQDNSYSHLINITMLSLIVGKELGLDDVEMKHLGSGAMLHDLGKMKIQERIVSKKSPLNEVELRTYKLYPQYGAKLAKKHGNLPKEVIDIIGQHREHEDGTGYPDNLKSDQISKLSKIVAITTAYDDHCNCPRNKKSLTPYEAMSLMYSQTKFDENILSIFINRLGVYPPGTLVKLSDGSLAGVTGVNHDDLLNPQVVLYDPEASRDEAVILELSEEPDLNIEESIRRSEASAEMISFLNFGGTMNYFLDPSAEN